MEAEEEVKVGCCGRGSEVEEEEAAGAAEKNALA